MAGTSAPTGWLLCDGSAVPSATYGDLYAVITNTYGGDATNFNLPDLRGRVIAGKDDMGGTSADRLTNQSGGLDGDTLGATGGAETHTLTEAGSLPSNTRTKISLHWLDNSNYASGITGIFPTSAGSGSIHGLQVAEMLTTTCSRPLSSTTS